MKLATFMKAGVKVGIVSICATAAFAQTSAVEQAAPSITSSTQIRSPFSNFRMTYFGDMSVPTTKADGSEWFHEPGLDYRFSGFSLKLKTGITQYFARTDRRENLFEVGDPSIGAAMSNLVRTDNFSLYGGINFSPATSEYSQKKQRVGALGVTLIPSSMLGTTNVKLDWMTSLKTYLYESDDSLNATNKRDLSRGRMSQYKAEFRPALTYRINDRLGAVLGGHLLFYQNRERDFSEWSRTRNALHAGLNYQVARSLSVRPEVRLPDPAKWNIATVEAGMLLFGSL